MTASARYFSRTPRYVFNTEDESLMRFAGMETRGQSVRARVRDLSETGIAFVVGGAENPEEGTVLKIEFTIPGRTQIACFATVVRVEARDEWDPDLGVRQYSLIACLFRNLPSLHARSLNLGLKNRVQGEDDFNWDRERSKHAWAFAGMSLALFLSLTAMAIPAASWVATVKSLFV